MSAISVILLVTAGTSVALSAAALHTIRGLRTEVTSLRRAQLPAARGPVPAEEIRAAVADALADERERELAEARAFWAEQDARESEGPGALLAGRGLEYEVAEADEDLLDALLERYLLSDSGQESGDGTVFVPRQQDLCSAAEQQRQPATEREAAGEEGESAELAAARRRHPSHPGYTLAGEPVEGGTRPGIEEQQRRTTDQLSQLAESRTPLADVRPGPLGTLDVYLFEDGTTLCLSPSQQETAERLAAAVRDGEAPVLMGGSGVSGAYALTFACGQDSVYLLADRIVST
ncbi:hypothetical protein N0X72_10425 [Streptomyces carpaticus]|uniref:Secreted protein n=2 Tax=Streptomyces TaxID=1883 RepID=A0A1I6VBQ3_9ACTN|nr:MULTISPECIES: hypothetical protein [Streptomyces]MCK1816858.1 hypothetical protein [Streptomyces sp. XM4011]QKV69378.1 hypothetical protein HUT13_11705 [Streptomyces harbinensis]UWM49400.1 hypothetical protein N0X72_10425 [Streptomyces carpaticus]SFT11163.1 hypothetical protein SAMN05444716_107322 [Streptomyces harbinensis]